MSTSLSIGIAGQKRDQHVIALQSALKEHNCNAPCLDFNNFPRFNVLNISPECTYDDIAIPAVLKLDQLDLLLVRGLATHSPENSKRETFISSANNELCYALLRTCILAKLENRIPVINKMAAAMYHRLKAFQYFKLHTNNTSVPETLVTGSIKEAKLFVEKYSGRVIVKPNTSAAEVVMADSSFFEKNGKIMSKRPFVFQQFVSGKSYRCYLLGGKIVSCGQLFFDRTYVDWRERVDHIENCSLEHRVQNELCQAVIKLQLGYCAVDIEYDTCTGKYYFLDFNPSGLFIGWSRLVGIDMASLIAEYLIQVIKNGGKIWV